MSKNTKLVWSDDPRDRAKVEDRKDKPKAAPESTDLFVKSGQWTAVFRLEKNGRGGKTVTILDQLPRNTEFVKGLCKEFKSKCGSGGTFTINAEAGVIEIQGDKRDVMKAILDKKAIKYKGM